MSDLDRFLDSQVELIEADWDPDAHPRGPDGKFTDGIPDVPDLPDTDPVSGSIDMELGDRNNLEDYMAGSHLRVNKDLRSGDLSDTAERISESVNRGIDQAGEFDETTVYRGIEAPEELTEQIEEGSRMRLNGFQSASHNPDTAANFASSPDWAESREDVLMVINTTRGLPTYNVEDLGASTDEQELILGDGWEYEVDTVDDDGEVKRVEMNLIGGDSDV